MVTPLRHLPHEDSPLPPLFVLGAVGAGVTAVGSILNAAGFAHPADEPSQSLGALDEQIRSGLGWSWEAPPASPPTDRAPLDKLVAEGEQLCNHLPMGQVATLASPRTSLTAYWWRRILGDQFVPIVVRRPPLDAMGSSRERLGISDQLSLAMWAAYYRHLSDALRGLEVITVDYRELTTRPRDTIPRLIRAVATHYPQIRPGLDDALSEMRSTGQRSSGFPTSHLARRLAVSESVLAVQRQWDGGAIEVRRIAERPPEPSSWEQGVLQAKQQSMSGIRRGHRVDAGLRAELEQVASRRERRSTSAGETQRVSASAAVLQGISPVTAARSRIGLKSEGVRTLTPPAPAVSVVMTAFNSADYVGRAIQSITAQTFSDWELIIVDDGSDDDTLRIAAEYARADERIKLFVSWRNHGTYWCKNFGIGQARGDFVTLQDSDDVSAPERLARQILAFEEHPEATVVAVDYVRTTDAGEIVSNRGLAQRRSFQSLMYRRREVLRRVGYYDSVRTSADQEQFERLLEVFGRAALVDIHEPLYRAFVRDDSLTGSGGSKVSLGAEPPRDEADLSFLSTQRQEYVLAFRKWHGTASSDGESLYVPFPPQERPFPAPEGMRIGTKELNRTSGPSHRLEVEGRHVVEWAVSDCHPDDLVSGTVDHEVVILSDFCFPGGTSQANIAEIEALTAAGITTALCQVDSTYLMGQSPVHPRLRSMAKQGKSEWLLPGERVRCRLLVIRHPAVLRQLRSSRVRVDADRIIIIANQVPIDRDGRVHYDVPECQEEVRRVFQQTAVWHPISDVVRESLLESDATVDLAAEDWHEVIDVADWTVNRQGWASDRPIIGRHSRPSPGKWPRDAATLRQVYPTDGSVLVHVLGGADAAVGLLGDLPDSWTVYQFGQVSPRQFLAGLDFFVYYHHPDLVEAFGRTILEALASGLPAVLPPHFETTFGEAALYAEPPQVQGLIAEYRADRAAYEAQAKRGLDYTQRHFSFETHVDRVRRLLDPVEVSRDGVREPERERT